MPRKGACTEFALDSTKSITNVKKSLENGFLSWGLGLFLVFKKNPLRILIGGQERDRDRSISLISPEGRAPSIRGLCEAANLPQIVR